MYHVGLGNYVSRKKTTAIVEPGSNPISRAIRDYRKTGMLIDATMGRRTKSVIFVDGYLILSALETETLVKRWGNSEK